MKMCEVLLILLVHALDVKTPLCTNAHQRYPFYSYYTYRWQFGGQLLKQGDFMYNNACSISRGSEIGLSFYIFKKLKQKFAKNSSTFFKNSTFRKILGFCT